MTAYAVRAVRAAKPDATVPCAGGIDRIFFLDLDDGVSVAATTARLQRDPSVEFAEPDFVGWGDGRLEISPQAPAAGRALDAALSPSEIAVSPPNIAVAPPNDPTFPQQWGLRNASRPGADIDALGAWGITTGSASTKLAILDSGIPLTAADFSGRLLGGYDFANNDANPTDDVGHGTNVASIAAATGNNAIGVAGVDWRCKILPVKILNSSNWGYYSWWISALTFATDAGAQVINMSCGGSQASSGLEGAVSYAAAHGAIVVAAMMNTNDSEIFYPAAYSNVIAVGATNSADQRAAPFCWGGGSNYNGYIDFVAPGNVMWGLDYQNPDQASYWCGTSQATPMVAGVICLIRGLDPSLSFQGVYDRLKAHARDRVGSVQEDTPGWDAYFGWGRIDASASLQSSTDVATSPGAPSVWLAQNVPNPFNPTTRIEFTISESGNVSLAVFDAAGRRVANLLEAWRPAGRHVVDFDAAALASGTYFYWLRTAQGVATRKAILTR
jgi:hypothetical protein